MKFTVLTLFPELITPWRQTGLIGAAVKKNLIQVDTINPRDHAIGPHRNVDDKAFGGSDGMVMKFEPIAGALAGLTDAHVAFLSPQGKTWDHKQAVQWNAHHSHVVLVCGRYAGFDHRLVEAFADEEISLGDYVLNGGEVAALAVMESVARLVPGVLGNETSAERESFCKGLLEAPVFTRPRDVQGMPVPSPLLSGNHAEIERFERDVSLVRTCLLRPDLAKKEGVNRECLLAVDRLRRLNENELRSLSLALKQLEDLANGVRG